MDDKAIDNLVTIVEDMASGKESSQESLDLLLQDIQKFCNYYKDRQIEENPDAVDAYLRHVLPPVLSKCSKKLVKDKILAILKALLKKAFKMLPGKSAALNAKDVMRQSSIPVVELSKSGAKQIAKEAGMKAAGFSALTEGVFLYLDYKENNELLASGKIDDKEYRKRMNGYFGRSIMTVASNGAVGYGLASVALTTPVGWAALAGGCVISYGCGKVGSYIGQNWF